MTTVDVEEWRGIAEDREEEEARQAKLSALLRTRTRLLLAELARPHRRKIWLYTAAIVLSVLAQTAIPALVGIGIDKGIPDARNGDHVPLLVIGLLVVACALLQAWLYRTFVLGVGRIGQDILFELRQRVFAHFQRLSLAFHERFTSGRMISRLTSDIDAINTMLDAGLDTLVTAVLSIVMVGTVLLVLDWPLGLVVLASFVPLLVLSRWYQTRSTVAYRRTREAIALVIVHCTEALRGIRAVHAFRREPRNDEIFQAVNDDYRATMTTSFQLLTVFWPGIRLIGNVTTAVILLVGGWRVVNGDMQVGVLAAFVLYLRRFFEPIADVSQFYDSFQGAAAGLEKLATVLDEEPSVPMPQESQSRHDEPWRGEVEFRDVRFAYREDTYVLEGFDLHIPAGQTLALLGRTGAGKSTIARLLARFYDPQQGAVTVDGISLRDLAEPDLRRAVAMVTQEAFLFTGSVADNVAFGRDPGGDRGGRPGGRPRHRRPHTAARLRRERRQERRPTLGRATAADRARPCDPGRPGGPDPRRGVLVARRADRAARPARPQDGAGGPDGPDHRPPAVDRRDRRPRRRPRGRRDRRGRHAGRPDRRRRGRVRRAAPAVARLPRLNLPVAADANVVPCRAC